MKSIFAIITKAFLGTLTVIATIALIEIGFVALHEGAKSHDQLVEIEKPVLPISISFRNAFFGPGGVAIFQNRSGQTLQVEALITSPTRTYFDVDLVIPAWGQKQIGPLDGWSIVSGQRIVLRNSNYRPFDIYVR